VSNGARDTVGTIDRPRLRAALDESSARVVLIVGPAGYGKTTLARQWVAESHQDASWYQCTEASADVAALAVGIARATTGLFPDGAQLIESRLRSATSDSADPSALVELILSGPQATTVPLLVLDDYHYLIRSGPAEQLVAELVTAQAVRLLICSRRRPSWASARRLLYGEIDEIGRGELAMTQDEVAEMLGHDTATLSGLCEIAEGWPAVVGLAARSRDLSLTGARRLPTELYEFFAEELYQALTAQLRDDLHRLVMLPSSAHRDLEPFFGSRAVSVIEELTRLGFLTPNGQADATNEPSFDLHPLLRDFVEEKIADASRAVVEEEASRIIESLLGAEAWDEAFSVLRKFGMPRFLPDLIERGLWHLLRDGRLSTVDEWLNVAHQFRLKLAVTDLAHAELLLRRGAWMQAIRLASDAADSLGPGHPLASRALNCAARAAHFSDRSDLATRLHRRALEAARRPEDVRQSLWGKFIAENSIDLMDEARKTLDEYDQLEVCDDDDLLRRMSGRLVFAARHGPLQPMVEAAPSSLLVLGAAKDPMTRTGFLQIFAYAMALAARYEDAREAAIAEIEEARRYRLDAIEVHALCALAMAEIGLRQTRAAATVLGRAEEKLRGVDDVHARMNIAALRMRIALLDGNHPAAFTEADRIWSRMPNAGVHGDLLATRGLVHVCAGDSATARDLVDNAQRATHHIETRVTAECVRAAALLADGDRAAVTASAEALRCAETTGAYDPFVISYRCFPALIGAIGLSDARGRMAWLMEQLGDRTLAEEYKLVSRRDQDQDFLSKREREVLDLVARGLTNREIARSLWISESTAKVHVRHIFDKLHVRTRTAAALKAREIADAEASQTATATNSGEDAR
jgi:LuxR family transcriptional regulator, maltose regulon positive regulatory protein